jgi:hypothetical protein
MNRFSFSAGMVAISLTVAIASPSSSQAQAIPIAQLDGRFVISIPAGQYAVTRADGKKSLSFILPTPKDGKPLAFGPNGMPIVPKGAVVEAPVEISMRNGRIVGCLFGREPGKNTTTCVIDNNHLVITTTTVANDGKGVTSVYRFPLKGNFPLKGSYANNTGGQTRTDFLNHGEIATLRRL